jgi:hypothetical protein
MMPKGFDLKCGTGKNARVWLQGKGGGLTPGQALALLPPKANEDQNSPAAYLSRLRTALIDRNDGHVNIVVCERLPRAQAGNRELAAGDAIERGMRTAASVGGSLHDHPDDGALPGLVYRARWQLHGFSGDPPGTFARR